jgi:3-hydroxyacyl-CoA dehydrogenase
MGHETLFVIGAGRMGRGIALSYSIAGAKVVLVDIKDRSQDEFERLRSSVTAELSADIEQLRSFGVLPQDADVLARVEVLPGRQAEAQVASAQLVYEAVPETMPAKQAALDWICQHAAAEATVASTTSTLNVEELAGLMKHPERSLAEPGPFDAAGRDQRWQGNSEIGSRCPGRVIEGHWQDRRCLQCIPRLYRATYTGPGDE